MVNIPKGTKDVLPFESYKWHYIESVAREVAQVFNVKEIRTPTFEHTEVFLRGVGDTTDIVNKEMYTFLDKGDRSITLKPEGTAGVCRSFIENGLHNVPQPVKMYYFTPVFRYERPQAGRLREHHQFGVEIYGADSPTVDAELILIAKTFFNKLGISGLQLNINSIGCKHCRAKFNEALKNYLSSNLPNMCKTCNERFDKNPLRILDCKESACSEINKNAPKILDYICEDCATHFKQLQDLLTANGVDFVINPTIVRGLDYYSKTVFEFVSNEIGAKGTVCGGGRYDGLSELLGGKPIPAVGFGLGLERLLLQFEAMNKNIVDNENIEVFVVNADIASYQTCFKLVNELRQAGISSDIDHLSRGIKAQFKYANKERAKFVIVIGETELQKGEAVVKDMSTSSESSVAFKEIVNYIKNKKESV